MGKTEGLKMFLIEVNSGTLYGPFESVSDAAAWAEKELGGLGGGAWSIKPLRDPAD